jgi:hypothetical protein
MKRLIFALAGLVATVAVCMGANAPTTIPFFTGAQDPSQLFNYLNQLIAQINVLSNANQLVDFNNPRNLLDNGQMQIQQRGTGVQTCGTTTIPSSAYAADRWGCNVNVTSGAGSLQVITSNLPAQPVFNAGMVFYRTSGALAQPQCVMQEIPTSRITPAQGKTVAFQVQIQGLANMLAETTTVNAYLFTGTNTDEGLQSFTASPAITPAFTGIASSQTAAFTITSSWAQYTATFSVGSTVTEAALALCWTPTTGGTAGTTDGFRFTGAQLEVGNASSIFEYRTYQDELRNAQAFYVQWADNKAATFVLPLTLTETTSGTTATGLWTWPQTMFKAPTVAVATATSFGMTKAADGTAGACSTLAIVASTATVNNAKFTCALSETAAVGTMHIGLYANTGAANTVTVSADF